MATNGARDTTYLPTDHEQGQLLDFVAALEQRGQVTAPQPALVSENGTRLELSPGLAEVLMQVAKALAGGQGVSVIPRHRLLTTQEAADILNVSRPTLIKRLEAGELAFELHGRHRRIRLDELLNYQDSLRRGRSAALDTMQRHSQADELYELLDAEPSAEG